MKPNEALAILAEHQDEFQGFRVKSLFLFGSVAREEARADSDVDFLVEFEEPGGLFQLLRLKHYLKDIFGCSVDLGTPEALSRTHTRICF